MGRGGAEEPTEQIRRRRRGTGPLDGAQNHRPRFLGILDCHGATSDCLLEVTGNAAQNRHPSERSLIPLAYVPARSLARERFCLDPEVALAAAITARLAWRVASMLLKP